MKDTDKECIEKKISCKRIDYLQNHAPGSNIDASFIPVIKKIRRKHFCTINSCSGTVSDHDQPRWFYFDKKPLTPHLSKYHISEDQPGTLLKATKETSLNGYVTIELMEVSYNDMARLDKRFHHKLYFSFKKIREEIQVTCDSIKIHERIKKSAKKNGFYLKIIIFRKTHLHHINIMAINIEPIETRDRIGLTDDEIIEKWTRFANDL